MAFTRKALMSDLAPKHVELLSPTIMPSSVLCITFWHQPAQDSLAVYVKSTSGYEVRIWKDDGVNSTSRTKQSWRQARIELHPNTPFQVLKLTNSGRTCWVLNCLIWWGSDCNFDPSKIELHHTHIPSKLKFLGQNVFNLRLQIFVLK